MSYEQQKSFFFSGGFVSGQSTSNHFNTSLLLESLQSMCFHGFKTKASDSVSEIQQINVWTKGFIFSIVGEVLAGQALSNTMFTINLASILEVDLEFDQY